MADKLSLQKTLEQGRAKFAYDCAEDGRKICHGNEIKNEWYKDDKYKSYVQKFPMLVKTNGLGSALAFYASKRQKEKDNKKAGTKNNPKNAYDLIYNQITEWLKKEPKGLLSDRLNNNDLVKVLMDLDSIEYRAVTNEVLAFFTWLKRFAEGLIEGD